MTNISDGKNKNLNKNELSDFMCKITKLEVNVTLLRRIRLITNECLCNGAYSSKNEIEQLMKLNKVNTPQWETDIIGQAITFKRKLAHNTLRELKEVLTQYKDLV